MLDETPETTTTATSALSDAKEQNTMSFPPSAEQTDTSDAENDCGSGLAVKPDEIVRSILDITPAGSTDASSGTDHGEQGEPEARSQSPQSSTHVDEVTRVSPSPDGTDSIHDKPGTSLNEARLSREPQENLISSEASQNHNTPDEEEDNNSIEDLLRDIQSVSSVTNCSQQKDPEGFKDPEGSYNLSRKSSEPDLRIADEHKTETVRHPSEPPVESHPSEPTIEPLNSMRHSEETEEKKQDGSQESLGMPLESPLIETEQLAPANRKLEVLEPPEAQIQGKHETSSSVDGPSGSAASEPLEPPEESVRVGLTSPPVNRLAPVPLESDVSVISTHTAMQPVVDTQDDPLRLSTVPDLPTFHQEIDARNSLQLPALPQLLPAHPLGHGIPNQLIPSAPAPGPAANGYHHQMNLLAQIAPPPNSVMMPSNGGKRKVHLRLVEDISSTPKHQRRTSFLSFRRKSVHARTISENEIHTDADRGRVTVSWYEGTTSLELNEHVRNTVIRKLGLTGTTKLGDMRVLDESSDPPEEIVLSTYIPDGSRLLLRFTTKDAAGELTPRRPSYTGGAPDSPSAAPSPYASSLDLNGLGLNPNQLALLGARLEAVQIPKTEEKTSPKEKFYLRKRASTPHPEKGDPKLKDTKGSPDRASSKSRKLSPNRSENRKDKDGGSDDDNSSTMEMNSLHPEDQIQKSLRQITELLIAERTAKGKHYVPRQEKRQVVFVLANYFVLFLSLIAISAEIQARAPGWNASVEQYLKNVRSCSRDQDALFECVSNGDLAGLMASVVLWFSRSAATKRIFLFGFESPQRLWTVVYESLVTAICWGFSYMFIRRGMNPDTSRNFLQKYWKDAIYGSLAGFNAAFLKHVLKNLIPQEAIEDALQDRQLKILSWLPSFS